MFNMTILAQIKQALQEMGFKAQPEAEQFRTELAAAKAVIASQDTAHVAAIAAKDAEIGELQGQIKLAQGMADTKAAEFQALADKLTASDKKVEEALAGMGVPVTQIPAAGPEAASGDVLAKLEAIKDPTERAKFRKANLSAIFQAFKQQQS